MSGVEPHDGSGFELRGSGLGDAPDYVGMMNAAQAPSGHEAGAERERRLPAFDEDVRSSLEEAGFKVREQELPEAGKEEEFWEAHTRDGPRKGYDTNSRYPARYVAEITLPVVDSDGNPAEGPGVLLEVAYTPRSDSCLNARVYRNGEPTRAANHDFNSHELVRNVVDEAMSAISGTEATHLPRWEQWYKDQEVRFNGRFDALDGATWRDRERKKEARAQEAKE